MYYINRPATWKAANRKWAEVHDYIDRFRECLVADELARDAMIAEIRRKVADLNAAYPRTKRLVVRFNFNNLLSCAPDDGLVDQYVFTIHFLPVRKTYRFAESTAALEEGGAV